MFSFRTTPLDEQADKVLTGGRLAVLCNQVAWNPSTREYLFESLYRKGNLKKVFVPSDGLFDERISPSDSLGGYSQFNMDNCEFLPLKGWGKDAIETILPHLDEIDALVVEFQDLGIRYSPLLSLLYNLFEVLHTKGLNISVYLLDRENPLGRGVEGTMLPLDYKTDNGITGLPHAHGLTLGEIANIFHSELDAVFPLHIISYVVRAATKLMMPWSVSPYANVPGFFTCGFMAGQYLWEGTNISSGRGTMRPYELFGAPFMSKLSDLDGIDLDDNAVMLRKTEFIPHFDKYAKERCYGFQLLQIPGMQYHSLAHQLRIMKALYNIYDEFQYSDDMIMYLGDDVLMSYLNEDEISWDQIKEHIKVEEQKWIRKAKKYLLYDQSLWRVKSLR